MTLKQYVVETSGRVWGVDSPFAPTAKAVNIAGRPFAESEREALQLTFAPNGGRFIAVPGSYSAHCCFEGTVLDIHAEPAAVVCETMDEADAVTIAALLNANGE